MYLRVTFTDNSIIVYREKWGTIAYQLAMGLICILIALYFYILGASTAPAAFLVVFCGMFSVGGLAILIRLPHQAEQILKTNGAQVMVADPSGIALTPNVGGLSRYNRWEVLSELILAETFNVVYVDGDENSYRCKLILIFQPGAHKKGHWLNEFGSGVAKSGEGVAYLIGDYPRHSGELIHRALQRLVPKLLRIRLCTEVEFNLESGKDSYTEV